MEILSVLEREKIGLPENYEVPAGIEDGGDLFIGYLILDAAIANNDRHDRNWSYSESTDGGKKLAPTYDHGSSFGADFGVNVWRNYSSSQFMDSSLSRFGERHVDLIQKVAVIRPKPVKIWLTQLEQVSREDIQRIFEQIPAGYMAPEASQFAQNLLEYNQTQLLGLKSLAVVDESKIE